MDGGNPFMSSTTTSVTVNLHSVFPIKQKVGNFILNNMNANFDTNALGDAEIQGTITNTSTSTLNVTDIQFDMFNSQNQLEGTIESNLGMDGLTLGHAQQGTFDVKTGDTMADAGKQYTFTANGHVQITVSYQPVGASGTLTNAVPAPLSPADFNSHSTTPAWQAFADNTGYITRDLRPVLMDLLLVAGIVLCVTATVRVLKRKPK